MSHARANRRRGEIEAVLDGTPMRLCLTLGALAELETAFAVCDLMALAERFERGRLSATDTIRIIGAGLRGAGHDVTDEAVARLTAEHGAAGFVDIVARLLRATFAAAPEPVPQRHTDPDDRSTEGLARPETRPFPGGR